MIAGQLFLDVEHHFFEGDAFLVAFASIEQAGEIIEGPDSDDIVISDGLIVFIPEGVEPPE